AALSYGKALMVAINNSQYQSVNANALFAQEAIGLKSIKGKEQKLFDYWNEKYYQSRLTLESLLTSTHSHPAIRFVDVPNNDNQAVYINRLEAEAIQQCLSEHSELQTNAIIVTPFYQQHQLLIKLL